MAFANSSISDIIATNIQSRTGELADNVTNNNALLRRLKRLQQLVGRAALRLKWMVLVQ